MRAGLRSLVAIAAVVFGVLGAGAATARAATPVGAGHHPDAVVDREGRTHVVWNESRTGTNDLLHYCRIDFGGSGCAVKYVFPPYGNIANNTDFVGPHVRVTPLGEVLIFTARCCGVAMPPSETANIVMQSADDGITWSQPSIIGDVEPGAPAAPAPIVYDDVDDRVLTMAGRTGQAILQAQPLGQTTTAAALLDDQNAYSPSVAQRGRNSFVAAWARLDDTTRVRTYDCTGVCPQTRPNTASTWTSAVTVPDAADPQLVAGPTGTFLFSRASDRTWQARRIDGTAVGAPQPVSAPGAGVHATFSADPATGRLHALYVGPANNLEYRTSTDGASWTLPHEVAPGPDFTIGHPALAAGQADGGPVGLALWTSQPGGVQNPQILSQPLPDPATLPYVVPPPPAPPAPPTPPGGGPPGPRPVHPCQILSFGPLDVIADSCMTVRGTEFTATGGVRINGLSVRLEGNGRITFDRRARTVESTGTVTVRAGAVVLWKGRIDWRIPAGTSWTVGTLDVGKFGGDLLGFPLAGKAELRLRRGAAEIPLHVGLPALFGGVTGDVTLRIDNAGGLRVRDLDVKVANAFLGIVQVKDLEFRYEADEDVWQGGATLILPPQPPGPSLDARVGFRKGAFDYARGELTFPGSGIPLDPFSVVYLQRIRFAVETTPELRLKGGVGLSAGPKIGSVRAIGVDGDLTLTLPDAPKPTVLRADGRVSIVDVGLASAYFELRTNGFVGFGGRMDLDLPGIYAGANFDGALLGLRFNVEAAARICLGGRGGQCFNGQAVVSSTGFGACADVIGLAAGVGYRWGESPDLFTGCDVGPYRASVAQAPGGARTVSIPSGSRGAFVAVRGIGAPPAVALVGPGGQRVEANGPSAVVVREADTTWFVLARPAAGAWRVEELPGSAPVRAVDHAQALPKPSVRATVRRGFRGSRARELSYRIAAVPGQRVWFAEEGAAAAKTIGVARGTTGTLRWTPADGPGGRRRIVAIVESYGRPRDRLNVASYVAPAPVVPAAPRGARVRRTGSGGAVVTWRPVTGAKRYLVRARLSDGRSLVLPATASGRRAVLPDVARTTTGTIRVAAVRSDGREGRAARLSLRRAARAR